MNRLAPQQDGFADPGSSTEYMPQAAERFHRMADEIEYFTRAIEQLHRAARPGGRDARRIAAAMDALMSASHYLHQIGEQTG